MKMLTWEQMGLIEQSRCERLARHLRGLLVKAEEADSTLLRVTYCWPVGADDIRTTMRLLDELLPGCDFGREREYYPPCDECGGHGWSTLTPGAYSGVVMKNSCPRCRGTGLLIPES